MSDSGDDTAAVPTEEEKKLRNVLWDKIGHIAAAHIGPGFERTDCRNMDKWLSKTRSDLEKGIKFCFNFERHVSSALQSSLTTLLTDVASGINEDLGTACAKAVALKRSALAEIPRIAPIVYKIEDSGLAGTRLRSDQATGACG
jgi:hypothetical protein